jgi:hypothetical protein
LSVLSYYSSPFSTAEYELIVLNREAGFLTRGSPSPRACGLSQSVSRRPQRRPFGASEETLSLYTRSSLNLLIWTSNWRRRFTFKIQPSKDLAEYRQYLMSGLRARYDFQFPRFVCSLTYACASDHKFNSEDEIPEAWFAIWQWWSC